MEGARTGALGEKKVINQERGCARKGLSSFVIRSKC